MTRLFDAMNEVMRSAPDKDGLTEWDRFLREYVFDDLPAVARQVLAVHGWQHVADTFIELARQDGHWPKPSEVRL